MQPHSRPILGRPCSSVLFDDARESPGLEFRLRRSAGPLAAAPQRILDTLFENLNGARKRFVEVVKGIQRRPPKLMTKIHFGRHTSEFPSNMLLACFSVVPSLILPQSRTLRTPAAAHRAALRCVGPDDSVDRVLDRVIERENESKAQLAAMAALSASSSAVALSSFAVAAELDAAAPVRADLDTVERVLEGDDAEVQRTRAPRADLDTVERVLKEAEEENVDEKAPRADLDTIERVMGDDAVRKSKRAAARAWLERVFDAAAPVRADLDTVERVMEEEEAAGDEEEASKPAAAQRRALAD